MLQSFFGTFDRSGLRSLRVDDDLCPPILFPKATTASFWAILDSDELPIIHRAVIVGHRGEALQMLAERAVCIGRS